MISFQHLSGPRTQPGDVKVFPVSTPNPMSRTPEDGPRPAELVTPEDLKRVLGVDVGGAEVFEGELPAPSRLSVRSCSYRSRDGVRVDVHTAAGVLSRYLMVLGHIMTRVQGRPLRGIGGGAMLYPGLVAVQADRGAFVIRVSAPSGPPPSDPLIDLARAAAARLTGTSPDGSTTVTAEAAD